MRFADLPREVRVQGAGCRGQGAGGRVLVRPIRSICRPCRVRVPSVSRPCRVRVASVSRPCRVRVPSVSRPCPVRVRG